MPPVAVQIAPPRGVARDEIELVADVDALSSTEVMLGCGNDNPY